MTVMDKDGSPYLTTDVGIGRGGLKTKTSMKDHVTPTGNFEIDIILYRDRNYNRINPKLRERYLQTKFCDFVHNKPALEQLFQNMNRIDFNGDKVPDNTYGTAFMGLNPLYDETLVTGPKFRTADWPGGGNTPYWYSIALHGTPDEKQNLGSANSGGCVHISRNVLSQLIESGIVEIGTQVTILDTGVVP